jgi:hypothetical protein
VTKRQLRRRKFLNIQERNNTQEATVEKNENMKKDKKLSPTSNTNKKQIWSTTTRGNRLITTAGSQSITAKEPGIQNTILEKIRRKERRNAKQSTQADYVPDGNITHPRQNKGHTDKHSPPPAPLRKPTISQEQPTQPVNLKDLLLSTKSPRDQAQNGQPTSHSTEEQADAPSPQKVTGLRQLT